MIDGKRVLGLIPARGGSKRLPNKNLKRLGGRPLIAWTIDAGRGSQIVDRLVLSTDDPEIMSVASACGCEVPFRRPAELATDDATSAAMARHALDSLDEPFDYLVLLQPTSPFRLPEDIDRCIRMCRDRGTGSVVTVCEPEVPESYFFGVDGDGRLHPDPFARGAALTLNRVNGAVFVVEAGWFRDRQDFFGADTIAHVMPRDRSVDIDTPADLAWAEFLLAAGAAGTGRKPAPGAEAPR